MLRGLACERYLAVRVAALLGEQLDPVEPVTHPHGVQCMGVSGDLRVRGGPLIEMKTSAFFAHLRWDGLPENYKIQAVIEAWAFGAPSVIVPVLVVPSALVEVESMLASVPEAEARAVLDALAPVTVAQGELHIYHVAADPDYAEAIVALCCAWWQRHIVDGEEPPATEREIVETDSREKKPKKARVDWKSAATEMSTMLGLRGVDATEIIAKFTRPAEDRTKEAET